MTMFIPAVVVVVVSFFVFHTYKLIALKSPLSIVVAIAQSASCFFNTIAIYLISALFGKRDALCILLLVILPLCP